MFNTRYFQADELQLALGLYRQWEVFLARVLVAAMADVAVVAGVVLSLFIHSGSRRQASSASGVR